MFPFSRRPLKSNLVKASLDAISNSQAMIEFDMDGTILTANQNFLSVMGYELSEIVGKSHSMFAERDYAASAAYRIFWEKLRRGEHDMAEYKRLAKGGREVWIQASYNPVLDGTGKPVKVLKIATDITAAKLGSADASGQLSAISKSQAVIEFDLSGNILRANENFCSAMGYSPAELAGRHHSMFVSPDYAKGAEYQALWSALRAGQFQAGEYRRIGKNGKDVWIQASYNPIMDMNGKPFKVVKYATDVTARKLSIDLVGEGLGKLAEGDLTGHIPHAFPPDLDRIRTAYNNTVARFGEIVGKLRNTSRTLKTATGEILSGANDLSERTTRQAAAIEETSAAMDQLRGTVEENARRAEAASSSARQVSEIAEATGEVISQSNDAMARISTSAGKISGIIGLIDDIAFQTNLLALNASVEAARAGDAGKGFAVVAVEVRRLAQSAASASADVKLLVEQSSNEVSAGNRLVSDAASRLGTVLTGLRQSAGLVEGIAQATQEQSSAIGQVSAAVRQMDEMTQHNAALVQQTNAAIEQTESQASELDRIVDVFVVEKAAINMAVHRAEPVRKPVARSAPSTAARTYLTSGNAAMDQDWSAF